jgi:hypothetical protein
VFFFVLGCRNFGSQKPGWEGVLAFSLNLRDKSALEGKDIRDDVHSASVSPHEAGALSALFTVTQVPLLR